MSLPNNLGGCSVIAPRNSGKVSSLWEGVIGATFAHYTPTPEDVSLVVEKAALLGRSNFAFQPLDLVRSLLLGLLGSILGRGDGRWCVVSRLNGG